MTYFNTGERCLNVDTAVVILLVAQTAGAIIMLPVTRWLLKREIYDMVEDLANVLFGKSKMSELGVKSGEKRKEKAIMDQVASDVLDGPKLAGLKMAAKAIGIDVDEYIAEHGAADTIKSIASLGQMLGINVTDLLSSGLNSSGQTVSGDNNPYLQ